MNTSFSKDDSLIFKGIAIVLMIIHHLYAFPDTLPVSYALSPTVTILGHDIFYLIAHYGYICVSVFAFITGYGMYSARNLNVRKRIQGHYIRYWRVCLIFLPLFFYFNRELFLERCPNVMTLILNLLGLSSSIVPIWWYFYLYLVLILLTPLLIPAIRKIKTRWMIVFLIIGFYVWNTWIPNHIDINTYAIVAYTWQAIDRGLPLYITGALCAKEDYIRVMNLFIKNHRSQVVFALLALMISVVFRMAVYLDSLVDCIYVILLSFSACWIIARIPYVKNIFIELGKMSGYMWLIHPFFTWYFLGGFVYWPRNTLLITIWCIFIVYLTSWVLKFIFEALLPKIFHRKSA